MGVIHMDDQLKTLQSWINESSYTVAVTGAGVSVTAGIPDMQHMNGRLYDELPEWLLR